MKIFLLIISVWLTVFSLVSCQYSEMIDETFSEVNVPEKLLGLNPISAGGRNFLSENAFPIDDTAPDFTFLQSEAGDTRVYLVGEYHAVAIIQNITMHLIRYLHKNAGLKHYLEEMDYLTCKTINRYLDTGDETYLQSAFSGVPGAVLFRIKEKYELYRQIYRFNSLLPSGSGIDVIGLDMNKQADKVYVSYLQGLLSDENIPDVIENNVRDFKKISVLESDLGAGRAQAKKIIDSVAEDIVLNSDSYRSYLGTGFTDFYICLMQQKTAMEYCDASISKTKRAQSREELIYSSFKAVYEKFPDDVFFGQWGNAHVRRSACGGMNWFAARLESEGSPVSGRVVSMYAMVRNCRGLTFADNGLREFVINSYATHLDPLCEISGRLKSKTTVFRLTGRNSPFETELYFLDPEASGSGKTTDYVQYLILFEDSPAASPL